MYGIDNLTNKDLKYAVRDAVRLGHVHLDSNKSVGPRSMSWTHHAVAHFIHDHHFVGERVRSDIIRSMFRWWFTASSTWEHA